MANEVKDETVEEVVRETAIRVYGSLDEILADGATEVEYVTLEGFKPGTSIRIGSVTAEDMMEWTDSNEGEAKRTAALRLIGKSLVDDKGNRYAREPREIHKLKKVRHKDTERILRAIIKLNDMTAKDAKETKND